MDQTLTPTSLKCVGSWLDGYSVAFRVLKHQKKPQRHISTRKKKTTTEARKYKRIFHQGRGPVAQTQTCIEKLKREQHVSMLSPDFLKQENKETWLTAIVTTGRCVSLLAS